MCGHANIEIKSWLISLLSLYLFLSRRPSCHWKLNVAFHPILFLSPLSGQSELTFASTCLHLLTNTSNMLRTTSWPPASSIRMWWTRCTCLSIQPRFWQQRDCLNRTTIRPHDIKDGGVEDFRWKRVGFCAFFSIIASQYKSSTLNPLPPLVRLAFPHLPKIT